MSILAWLILGLIAGALAKVLRPGPDGGGVLGTMVVGVLGAFIGGAFLLLVIYNLLTTRARPKRVV